MALTAQKAALDAWETRIANATRNLGDLQNDVTFKLLSDDTQSDGLNPRLQGATREQLSAALAGMIELWKNRNLVKEKIDSAQRLYEIYTQRSLGARILGSGPDEQEVARQIDMLLNSQSIQLPPVNTPLAQRRLSTAATAIRTISPDALFRTMEDSFAAVSGPVTVERSGQRIELGDHEEPMVGDEIVGGLVTRIGQIWHGWSDYRMDAAARLKVLQARARVNRIGVPELDHCAGQLEALETQLLSDPLTIQLSAQTTVTQALDAVESRLDRLDEERKHLDEAVDNAQQLHLQLLERHEAAKAKVLERQCKIDDPQPERFKAAPADNVIASLSAWLQRLAPQANEGKMSAVIGLQRFAEQARIQIAACRDCIEDNEKPCAERRELKDRFNCMQVRVSAEGLTRYEDVMDASCAAAASLQRPTNLSWARTLIDEFERLTK